MTTQAATNWQSKFDTETLLVDLSQTGLIAVTGEDAKTFLQGQVTNDVNAISASNSHYTGYCNPKGRLLALFFAFQHQDALYLSLDAALVPSVLKRLQMYVLRAKVTLNDAQHKTMRFGVAGEHAEAQLLKHYPTLPQTAHEVVNHDGVTIIRMPYVKPAFQIIADHDKHDQLFAELSTNCTPVDLAAWHYLETLSGIPEIVAATQEAFVPQMVNLDALGGINFKKGCYTGQEIVARTHYLGKVKRRTLLGEIQIDNTDGTIPAAGDAINDAAQQNVGQVVRASISTQGNIALLFECRIDSTDTALRWQNCQIETKALPYDTSEEDT